MPCIVAVSRDCDRLDGHALDEYVVFEGANTIFGRNGGQWRIVGALNTIGWAMTPEPLFDWLDKATITSTPHRWNDLVINGTRFVVQEDSHKAATVRR